MIEMSTIPRLAAGCRLHPTADILLIPEGTLNLSGPARDILTRVDGQRTVAALVDDLMLRLEGASREQVAEDVLYLLYRMQQRGVVRA